MPRDRHTSCYIPFRCSAETEAAVIKVAADRNWTKSEALRHLVEKGLVADGYKLDEDALLESVRHAVKDVVQPQIERLAATSAT